MRNKRKSPKIRRDTTYKSRGLAKKAKLRKTKAPKTRNDGTMTESEFWSFIRSALRNKTRFWRPRLKVLRQARRVYHGPNKRQKWELQCSVCKEWFMQKNVEVNHKVAAGSLKAKEDLPQFIENLFCEADGLEVVCKPCHKAHHKQ